MVPAGGLGFANKTMSATTLSPSKPKRPPVLVPSRPSPQPPRILLVDEDDDLRLLYADVLTPSGYRVDGAADSAAAWQALVTERFDLLITSNKQPTLTGVKLLKKLQGARMHLPVILISGMPPTVELNRHPRLKVVATLFKPHTNDELVATVQEVLGAPVDVFDPFALQSGNRARTGATPVSTNPRIRRWNFV